MNCKFFIILGKMKIGNRKVDLKLDIILSGLRLVVEYDIFVECWEINVFL